MDSDAIFQSRSSCPEGSRGAEGHSLWNRDGAGFVPAGLGLCGPLSDILLTIPWTPRPVSPPVLETHTPSECVPPTWLHHLSASAYHQASPFPPSHPAWGEDSRSLCWCQPRSGRQRCVGVHVLLFLNEKRVIIYKVTHDGSSLW